MQKAYSLLLIMFFSFSTQAQIQPPGFEWAKSFGGWASDGLYDMGADDEGHVYVCGNYYEVICFDTICVSPPTSRRSGTYLAKYDSLGNVVWAQHFAAYPVVAIEVSKSGDIYIAGHFTGSIILGMDTLVHPNRASVWGGYITKLNKEGAVQWAMSPGETNVFTLLLKEDALYLTGGLHVPSLDFGEIIIQRKSKDEDVYFAKFDTSGKAIYVKILGEKGSRYANISALAVSEEGKVFISGGMYDTLILDDLVITQKAKAGNYVAAFDEFGTPQWVQQFHADTIGHYVGINGLFVIDNYRVIGFAHSWGFFYWDEQEYNSFNGRHFTFGVDFEGNKQFIRLHPSGYSPYRFFVNKHQIYGCGNRSGDIQVNRYDSTGNLVWKKRIFAPDQNDPWGIAGNSKGNLYVVGGFYEAGTYVDTHVVYNSWCCNHELWVGRMSIDSFVNRIAVSTSMGKNEPWEVYPNPFSDKLYISGNIQSPMSLEMRDLQGRIVWTKKSLLLT